VRKGFVGLDGLISLYRDYRRLTDGLFQEPTACFRNRRPVSGTDGLFQELPLAKLAIENSGRNWPAYERWILHGLGLPTGRGRRQ
jgi:hypothetical protein